MSHLKIGRIILVFVLFIAILIFSILQISKIIRLNNLDDEFYEDNYYFIFLDFNKPYLINYILELNYLNNNDVLNINNNLQRINQILDKYPENLNNEQEILLFKDLNQFYNAYPLANYNNCYENYLDSNMLCVDKSIIRLNQLILDSFYDYFIFNNSLINSNISKKHISKPSNSLIKDFKKDIIQVPKIDKNNLGAFFNDYSMYSNLNIVFINYSYNERDLYYNYVNDKELMIYEYFRDTLLINDSEKCFSFILDPKDIEFANNMGFDDYYSLVCQKKMRVFDLISKKLSLNSFEDYFIFGFVKNFFENNDDPQILLYSDNKFLDSNKIYDIIKNEFLNKEGFVLNNQILKNVVK